MHVQILILNYQSYFLLFSTENHGAMPETLFEPHVQEMETVLMEVEL